MLALLAEEKAYGFDLIRKLSAVDGMMTSEGTIYPLLSRLRRSGLVSTMWRVSDSGPPRRYYQITEAGSLALTNFADDWRTFRDSVDNLMNRSGDLN